MGNDLTVLRTYVDAIGASALHVGFMDTDMTAGPGPLYPDLAAHRLPEPAAVH